MCLDPHLNYGWGWRRETGLSTPVKYFYWPFQGGTSFGDHLCFLCLVFLMLSRLWSPAGKGLTSWLLLVMFIVFLLLSHVVSWVRCGFWLYRFLIFAVFLTFIFQNAYYYQITWSVTTSDYFCACSTLVAFSVFVKNNWIIFHRNTKQQKHIQLNISWIYCYHIANKVVTTIL